MLKNIASNFNRYQFLMKQLISRDFKVKYKRSVLGILWSLLYPILMMLVMAVVFSKMFRFSVPGVNYFVYFEVGFIMFNYFSEATNNGMTSVVFNFNLLTKVYIPKYIFPLSKCLFCGFYFDFNTIVFCYYFYRYNKRNIMVLLAITTYIFIWIFIYCRYKLYFSYCVSVFP